MVELEDNLSFVKIMERIRKNKELVDKTIQKRKKLQKYYDQKMK